MDKKCSKCSAEKSESEYYFSKRENRLYAMCKACHKLLRDSWRLRHPDYFKAKNIERMADKKKRELKRAHSNANSHKYRGQRAEWCRTHKLERNEIACRRRARAKGTEVGKVSYDAIILRDGWVCYLCHENIGGREELHFDHWIPLAKGGTHTEDNIHPAHARCNLSKGAKILIKEA